MSEIFAQETALFGGALRLLQPLRGHRAGTDAVLLAACVAVPRGRIADLGSSTGTIGLALAQRGPDALVVLIDTDAAMLALARRNIALNDLGGRVSAAEADIFSPVSRRSAQLVPSSFDLVVSNPPFFAAGRGRPSPDSARASAHVMAQGGLTEWIRQGAALLRAGGRLALIHRADALGEVLEACKGRLGGLVILPVHARENEAAIRILAVGVKGSRAPLTLKPPLILHEGDGAFTPFAQALHQGAAQLDL